MPSLLLMKPHYHLDFMDNARKKASKYFNNSVNSANIYIRVGSYLLHTVSLPKTQHPYKHSG